MQCAKSSKMQTELLLLEERYGMLTLSVIVPVYNTEEYLEDCIKSILMQSFKDFELIIVNDGSTDGSSAIINKYAATDSRIVVIDTVNKGVSNARNLGLRAAKGTYVGFVDSDDTIAPDMYQKLIDSMRTTDSEMACCLAKQVNVGAGPNRILEIPSVMDNKEFIIHIFDRPPTVYTTVWNKLFLRDRITENFDTNLVMDEDTRFLVHYSMKVERVSFLEYVGYHYNRNDLSLTKRDTGNIAVGLPARRVLIEEIELYSEEIFKAAEENFLDSCCCGVATALNNRKTNYYHIAKNELLRYVRKHPGHILLNRTISWKLKLVIGFRIVQCLLVK